MKTDSNLCPSCATRSSLLQTHCKECHTELLLDSTGGIAVWQLGEVRPAVLKGIVRELTRCLGLPVTVQPAELDPRPSQRDAWNGISATAFLNQVDRRSKRRTAFSLGVTEQNIVPGAHWNFLFGYAYLGLPSCVISLHPMSIDNPTTALLVKRAATIAIHELGHNCGLDHHDYDEGIPCVMTADEELDSLELLDEGTHRFCRACQEVVDRKLRR